MMESKGQHVRFCTSSDGVQLAYEKTGKGPPVVCAAYWLTHLEHDDQGVIWGAWLREFAKYATLIRYDQRGCGLSDREVADISFEAWMHDLETRILRSGGFLRASSWPTRGPRNWLSGTRCNASRVRRRRPRVSSR